MKTRVFLLAIVIFYITSMVHGATVFQSGMINGDDVNLRAEPGPYGHIITTLPNRLAVSVVEQSGRWYKVELPDGRTGWIYRQFIEVKAPINGVSRDRFTLLPMDNLIQYAKSFLEVTYIYGGDTPRGFDCSGFTMYVFAKFGISLPHQANLQKEMGAEVPGMGDLVPGNLVFFKTEGSPIVNHVGIYLGDNKFIHASSGYGAVRISPLDSGYYYNCYAGGRRLADSNRDNLPDELERM
jgi:hypothetical protein